jgi:hypothetical protein
LTWGYSRAIVTRMPKLERKAKTLIDLAEWMRNVMADIDGALAEGDLDMAGDHALTLEEYAREFQKKVA